MPGLVQYLGSCTWKGQLGILMELMPEGTLYQSIGAMTYTWNPEAMAWALDIARGLRYLHSPPCPIAHLDLKTPNILIR